MEVNKQHDPGPGRRVSCNSLSEGKRVNHGLQQRPEHLCVLDGEQSCCRWSTFRSFPCECSTPPMLSTMLGYTPFRCPQFSCWKILTSDSWWHKQIKLHHLEPRHTELPKILNVSTTHRPIESAICPRSTTYKLSDGDMDTFDWLKDLASIGDTEFRQLIPPQQRTETFSGATAPLSNNIA